MRRVKNFRKTFVGEGQKTLIFDEWLHYEGEVVSLVGSGKLECGDQGIRYFSLSKNLAYVRNE